MGVSPHTTQRAYSLLTVKGIDEDARIITGIASTPETDRVGDIVEPRGAQFTLPMPLLWQHDHHQPIGEVFAAHVTDGGIEIKARIARISEPGRLKDRLDEAWQAIKFKLVRGLSIGFSALEVEPIKGTYGYRFLKWAWLELSAVTIPANADASIQSIKSFDVGSPAAPGTGRRTSSSTRSGAPESRRPTTMKNTAEQIDALRAELRIKTDRLEALVQKADAETLTDGERDEQDELPTEIQEIVSKKNRLEALEAGQKAMARPVSAPASIQDAGGMRQPAGWNTLSNPHVEVRPNRPVEMGLVRVALCKMAGLTLGVSPLEIAKARYPDDFQVQTYLKAAIAGASTSDATWAGPLVAEPMTLVGEFIGYLRPKTIIGKFGNDGIPPLNNVPFNVRVQGQTSGGSGYWVGGGAAKPLTRFDYNAVTLLWAKVAAISVISQELARFSSPSAEATIRRSLTEALVERLDIDFIDPTKAAVTGVSPASITNGIAALTPSGTDSVAVRADLAQLFTAFINANLSPTTGVFIMPETVALQLSLMRNAFGQKEFPDITMNGGRLEGLPVITSQHASTGSPVSNLVILVNANDIYLSDDGDVTIDASTQATLEMADDPTMHAGTGSPLAPVAPTGAMVSMYQTNQIALRAERFINWQRRRDAAVAYLDSVAYASGSPA